jgi:ABC-type transport system involved in multi-copper enzyme maturation permease subunit
MAVVAVNPVLRRELTERMRGWRACIVLTLYLGALALSLYIAYQVGRNTNDSPSEIARSFNAPAKVGRGIFEYVLFLMLLLVLFLVPGQTSGALAGERERQTLIPLQVTLLRPRSIILGKIGAALAFLTLLVVATMPLLAVCYLIGGVSMSEVLGGVAVVLFVGLVVACVATAISAFTARVQLATVLCYGFVLFLVAGTLAARQAAQGIDAARGVDEANAPSWILLPNPVATLSDIVDDGQDFGNSMKSPFDWMERTLAESETEPQLRDDSGDFVAVGPGGDIIGLDENGEPIFEEDRVADEESPFWWQSMVLLGALAAVAVVAGSLRLRTPAAKER